jgi:predicted N-formylglutamate amidohydrolase
MTERSRSDLRLLLTCEHAGNRIPREYRRLFRGAEAVLASHRGWDPGALVLARSLGRRLGEPVLAVTWCRLLVESNRSPTNPRIWSRWTAALPSDEKARILERYWWPHRRRVERAVRDAIEHERRVIHVAVHSFTPTLDGEVRNADVGLLYDPARDLERRICGRWSDALGEREPGLRVRRNYPYRGSADGLTTWLRRRHPAEGYLGLEVEVNQAYLAGPARADLARVLAETLARVSGVHEPAGSSGRARVSPVE